MDKMGESSKAGNRGTPASPRAGAPVEITGLLKSCLRWLVALHQSHPEVFPHKHVSLPDGATLDYKEWDAKVLANFDKEYYVPENPEDDSKCIVRGMYKDVVGAPSNRRWSEYQLRPNQCIAMAVAPELFPPQHAVKALKMVEDVLIKGAPLGVRTLDPTDNQYNGDYTNMDGDNYKTAGGFNYHNGPEWVWPLGYFLDAKLHFHKHSHGESPVGHMVHKFLRHHRTAIAMSHFRGLPELTNSGGAYCSASCEVQAWSSGSILAALHHVTTCHHH